MCQCALCDRNDMIREFIMDKPQEVQEFVMDMNEMLIHAEMDKEYYRSVVYGTWPDADELIQTARKIQANRNKRENQNDTTVHSTSESKVYVIGGMEISSV